MISPSTRRARSRLANAIRLGYDGVPELRTAYDIERVLDAIDAVRGDTTPAQRDRLHAAVDAAGSDRA